MLSPVFFFFLRREMAAIQIPKFGIEYEICIHAATEEAHNSVNEHIRTVTRPDWKYLLDIIYIKQLQQVYNIQLSDSVFTTFANQFDNCILIYDGDKYWKYDFRTAISNDLGTEDGRAQLITYNYPLITIDPTVKCSISTRNKPKENYTINMEIVSQILTSKMDLDRFTSFFIEPFESSFVKNESQGVHVTIDISPLLESNTNLSPNFKQKLQSYYTFERNHYEHMRKVPSNWANPVYKNDSLSVNSIKTISNLQKFVKNKSIHYKHIAETGTHLLEFRLFSPFTPVGSFNTSTKLFDGIKSILDMFHVGNTSTGGNRTRRKKLKRKSRKTAKAKKLSPMIPQGTPVFVYGSLRKGLPNHKRVETSPSSGEWETKKTYYMIGTKSGVYPYVSEEQLHEDLVASHIHGEVYIVDDDVLSGLDVLEGHPTQYKRVMIPLQNGKRKMEAYMYLLESEELKEGIRKSFSRRFVSVPEGDWVRHLGLV